MVNITNRSDDPIAKYPLIDAYMRWALEAVEEVAGHEGMAATLRHANLEKYIDNYPPEETKVVTGVTWGEYASLNAGLLTFYGRAGRGIVKRVGRITAQKAFVHQSDLFNLGAVLAAKTMPVPTQIKMGLTAQMAGLKIMCEENDVEWKGTIEDKGTTYHVIIETDPLTAGKSSDSMMGWLMEGAMEQAALMAFGKTLDMTQIACKSMGDAASIWESPKQFED
jgi:hypothetical protein